MFRTGKGVMAACFLCCCIGCPKSGLLVAVQVTDAGPLDLGVMSELEGVAQSDGLVVIREREPGAFEGEIVSSYARQMSAEAHDVLTVRIIWATKGSPHALLTVAVQNRLHGKDPSRRLYLEAVAQRFYDVLEKRFGRQNVRVERQMLSELASM